MDIIYRINGGALTLLANQTSPTNISGTAGDSVEVWLSEKQTATVQAAAGADYTENWSSYANGNTWTEMETAYTRNATAFVTSIVTNASAPGGLECQYGVTSNALYYAYRDDIATGMAGSWTVAEWYGIFRMEDTSTSGRSGFGYTATNSFGVAFQRFGTDNTAIRLIVNADPGTTSGGAVLATNRLDGEIVHIRCQIEGADIRGRFWTDGDPEPGTWSTLTHSGSINPTHFGLIGRSSNPGSACLYYEVTLT